MTLHLGITLSASSYNLSHFLVFDVLIVLIT